MLDFHFIPLTAGGFAGTLPQATTTYRVSNFRSGFRSPETGGNHCIPPNSGENPRPRPPPCPPGNKPKFPVVRLPLVVLNQSVQVIVSSGAIFSREAKRPSGESAS